MTASLHEKPSERFVTAGLGFGLIFALCGAATAGHLPFPVGWLAYTAVVIAGFTGMTRYKRNGWGWLWTGYVTAVCAAEAVAHLAGADGSQAAAGLFWAAGGLIAIGWACMLSLERNRKPDPLPVQQVVNHYVFHGLPGGAHLPLPLPGTAVPGEVVQDPGLPGITAPTPPARHRGAPHTAQRHAEHDRPDAGEDRWL